MAKFGLKKQGTLWGLFHGSDMVSDVVARAGGRDGNAPKSRQRLQDPELPEQQPTYDNDSEYGNVRTALEEARQHPPLENPEKQRERERLQREVEALATAFESKHGTPNGIVWDAEAEEALHTLMQTLIRLLTTIGLSLEHGWAYTGAD